MLRTYTTSDEDDDDGYCDVRPLIAKIFGGNDNADACVPSSIGPSSKGDPASFQGICIDYDRWVRYQQWSCKREICPDPHTVCLATSGENHSFVFVACDLTKRLFPFLV